MPYRNRHVLRGGKEHAPAANSPPLDSVRLCERCSDDTAPLRSLGDLVPAQTVGPVLEEEPNRLERSSSAMGHDARFREHSHPISHREINVNIRQGMVTRMG